MRRRARADYLVTGNQRHFPKFWKKTKVITSREFISIVAPISFHEKTLQSIPNLDKAFNRNYAGFRASTMALANP
jgi:hypothetical protein